MARSGAATIEQIIEAAEQLFGQFGPFGVSLRQIGRAAGAANNFAVQFHFRDRDGLIAAIFERRFPQFEARRNALLGAATKDGRSPGAREVLEIIYLPFVEQLSADGRHSYAAFMAGLHHFGLTSVRGRLAGSAPVTERLTKMLAESLPDLSQKQFRSRFQAVNTMILTTISQLPPTRGNVAFNDLITIAAAALQADARSNAPPLVGEALERSTGRTRGRKTSRAS